MEIVKLPVPTAPQGADEHAAAETKRKQDLFAWVDTTLEQLGLKRAIDAARSVDELRPITLDAESAELAIRDALHPASGDRQECFSGLNKDILKRLLGRRLAEIKGERETVLWRRRGGRPDWEKRLKLDKEGRIKPILANLILILTEAPDWKGVLAYDEFAARVVIKRPAPLEGSAPDTPWTDHCETQTRAWFQSKDINPAAGDVGKAVQAAARANAFHPVKDYFSSLAWDGVPRAETWLQDFLHVEDSAYARAIGPRFLISVVARVFEPSCKVDHMLVLEGPQGKQKSEALRTLAVRDAWFSDRLSHVASKDAAIETAGVLLIEIAEMEALTKATSSAMKSFLTRRSDRYRPPYGKHATNLPRQCVFAGTINPPAGGYLKDPTGARRFWPVACHGMIDRSGLEQARDQLWAEATARYKASMPWWLETAQLEALADAEQEARFVVDAWEEPVREWLRDRIDVSLWDVLKALGLDRQHQTQRAQKRIVAILTRMGFTKRRPRAGEGRKGREHRYQRDPPLKKVGANTGDHGWPNQGEVKWKTNPRA